MNFMPVVLGIELGFLVQNVCKSKNQDFSPSVDDTDQEILKIKEIIIY